MTACHGRPCLGGDIAVDDDVEPGLKSAASSTAGALRDDETTATLVPRSARWSSSWTEPAYGWTPSSRSTAREEFVLAIAESADGFELGTVAGIAVGQLDAAGREERPDAVVAWLAVDVVEVVALDVRLGRCRAWSGSR